MATDFERILLQVSRKNPETIKAFLMRSLRRQQVEMSFHPINHETIIGLACSKPSQDNASQQFMEATLGGDYNTFRGICLALAKSMKRNGISFIDAICTLKEADSQAYEQYLGWAKALDRTGRFKNNKFKSKRGDKDMKSRPIHRTLEFDQMKSGKTATPDHQQTKGSGDEFQDNVDQYAKANNISFPKALVHFAEESPKEFAAYNQRVNKVQDVQQMAFAAKQQSEDILEPEKQIAYLMAVENVDRHDAIK